MANAWTRASGVAETTPGTYYWDAPSNISGSMTISMTGAGGGSGCALAHGNVAGTGGAGGSLTGTWTAVANTRYYIVVGGGGGGGIVDQVTQYASTTNGGTPGGGGSSEGGGSGGGYSGFFKDIGFTFGSIVCLVGGGGGSGGSQGEQFAGGDGGSASGGDGAGSSPGIGGTTTAGGSSDGFLSDTNGSELTGGNGAGATAGSPYPAGGGGGYYGGGGGRGGGGGGSSAPTLLGFTITVNTKGGAFNGATANGGSSDGTAGGDGSATLTWSTGGGGITPVTSTINLTMSCLSTIFSGYGGGARGYHLQSYSSIRFYDGSYGPASPPINMGAFLNKSAYTGGGGGTQTFTTTGTFTVPSGITSLDVILRGSWGDSTPFSTGGYGGLVSGTFAVTAGETLGIIVNEGGGSGSGGNGGGRAAIQRASVDKVTAGGGGSGGGDSQKAGANGGDGGGEVGDSGAAISGSGNATGGTQTTAGLGAVGSGPNGNDAIGYVGGTSGGLGGGGGGGWYGGGGGGEGSGELAGGGGGGSSRVVNLFGTVVNTKGGNTTITYGNIVITWPGTGTPPTTKFLTATDNSLGTVTGIGTDTIIGSYTDLNDSASPWIISGTFANVGTGNVEFYLDTSNEPTLAGQLTFTATINSTQVFSVDMQSYSSTQYDNTFSGYTGTNNTFSISISVNSGFLKVGGPINYNIILT